MLLALTGGLNWFSQLNGGRESNLTLDLPAYFHSRAVTSLSSGVIRLPITRNAIVMRNCERIPIGPNVGNNLGTVIKPASLRAIEKAVP